MKVRVPSKIIIISISVIVAFSFLVTLALLESFTENKMYSYNGVPRAAILDQLNDDIPNKAFQEKATAYLEEAGYEVDLFTTKQLTVDFYKTLPKMNYGFIVVRSHAIGSDGPDYFVKEPVSIFTGEKYADNKYIQEQLLGQLGKGAPYLSSAVEVSVNLSDLGQSNSSEGNVAKSRWSLIDTTNPYFLVGSKYVDDLMEGRFPNSVIVLAGCSTLSNPLLAKSFINRGASTVLGWDRLVGSDRNDRVTLAFLENFLVNHMEVDKAVQYANKKFNLDSESDPTFAYYNKSL